MRLRRFLLRLLGFELLATELLKLLLQMLRNYQAEMKKKVATRVRQSLLFLFVLILLCWALFFGLIALSFYLNTWLESSYQGFLVVSGGCVLLSLAVLVLRRWL